jgi:hypothetical protein
MISTFKEKLLTWLSKDHLTGLRASWPAQFQLKERVVRLADTRKSKGMRPSAYGITLLSVVLLLGAGVIYSQSVESIKNISHQVDARISFDHGLDSGDIYSTSFKEALDILYDQDPSIPTSWPLGDLGWPTFHYGPSIHPFTGQLYFHKGFDIAARRGSPVYPMGAGVVEAAEYHRSYGNLITIDHGNGFQSRYAQLDRMHVSPGERVEKGDHIGDLGNTGLSTGPHLHLELRYQIPSTSEEIEYQYVDPTFFLRPMEEPYNYQDRGYESAEEMIREYNNFSGMEALRSEEDGLDPEQNWQRMETRRLIDREQRGL